MSMFATPRGATSGPNRHVVEFKAGRSNLQPGDGATKKKVVADPAKGLVYVKQTNDQLVHFCWKNRETGAVLDDLIIFPGDTEFKEVKGCPDGQVFCLKFKSSNEFRLFWVQEPAIDKDIVKKVNDALNKPAPPTRMVARGGDSEVNASHAAAALAALSTGGSDDLGALGNLDHQQLLQLLQFGTTEDGPPGTATIREGPRSSQPPPNIAEADISTLQQLIAGLKPQGSASPEQRSVDLAAVITGTNAAETARNNADRLIEHLPDSDNPKQELQETVHSPQFRQAATGFGHALQTGQMAPVLGQFGVSQEAKEAAENGDLLEFSKKLTESEQKAAMEEEIDVVEDSVKEPEPKRGKPDDQMDLD